jgi:predicted PurR-regulated permease PerM
MEHEAGRSEPRQREFARHSLMAVGIVAAIISLIALAAYIIGVLLLVFAAVLLAIPLHVPAAALTRRTGLAHTWSLTLVILGAVVILTAIGWLFGHVIVGQVEQLAKSLPSIVDNVQQQLRQYDWLTGEINARQLFSGETQFIGKGLKAVSSTFGAIVGFGIAILMAVFLAAQPGLYINGIIRLIPIPRRRRAGEVLSAVGDTLSRWLLGQLVLMLIVAVLTGAGLALLKVPYPLALGLLAGLLTFIPYLGPILALIPAALVAFGESSLLAGYVALLYAGVQTIENLLEPLVQQRAVYLPPVLLLFAQLALGILVGAIGVVVATPLTAALMVMTKMVYVEDMLGDRETSATTEES